MTSPFHSYDIRGLFPEEINAELVWRYGKAYMDLYDPETAVVGHDMRLSSPELHEALVDALLQSGCRVWDIGLASTDMMYLAVINWKTAAGFMITASHNGPRYNGVKTVKRNAVPVGMGSGLEKLKEITESQRSFCSCSFSGKKSRTAFLDEYTSTLFSLVAADSIPPMSVAIDSGNGMGGLVLPRILERLPLKSENIFFDLDGTFPNHEANPMIEKNRTELVSTVLRTGSTLGFAPDGDCDRGFFIDERGRYINGDFTLAFLLEGELENYPGKPCVYDVRCSNKVRDTILNLGGIPVMGKVGHAYGKALMLEKDAAFGGEVSGHYYFRTAGGVFDSGPLALLKFLYLLGKKGKMPSHILDESENYHISGELSARVSDPDKIIQTVINTMGNGKNIITTDGIRIEGDDFWFSIRKSNTEPLLRLNVEADTASLMETVRDEIFDLFKSFSIQSE
ncbi:MAG: phosphomannomutase/phosphoglucomutase [Deltaproteobacteria bacterium]|nr:phosphomannomutase/phosphoglucomutase [Deltaproteobacteria bacterium]